MKTILLVEDDDATAEVLTEAIALEKPYQVLHAKNSERALEMVGHIKANLFILDYLLPLVNGIELYDRLHALEGLQAVPAILITANNIERLQEDIQSRGMLSLAKPFDLDILLETIELALASSPASCT
jgi:CheY-like chemotaxis protein